MVPGIHWKLGPWSSTNLSSATINKLCDLGVSGFTYLSEPDFLCKIKVMLFLLLPTQCPRRVGIRNTQLSPMLQLRTASQVCQAHEHFHAFAHPVLSSQWLTPSHPLRPSDSFPPLPELLQMFQEKARKDTSL